MWPCDCRRCRDRAPGAVWLGERDAARPPFVGDQGRFRSQHDDELFAAASRDVAHPVGDDGLRLAYQRWDLQCGLRDNGSSIGTARRPGLDDLGTRAQSRRGRRIGDVAHDRLRFARLVADDGLPGRADREHRHSARCQPRRFLRTRVLRSDAAGLEHELGRSGDGLGDFADLRCER